MNDLHEPASPPPAVATLGGSPIFQASAAPAPSPVSIPGLTFLDDVTPEAGEGASSPAEQERALAFHAAPFEWRGVKLAAFAVDREGDWLLHRSLLGVPPLSQILGDPPSFLGDACRILWFCSHEPEQWIGRLGMALEKDIRAWSVQHIPPGTQTEATTLALQIYTRAHLSQAMARPERTARKGDDPGNSPGPC